MIPILTEFCIGGGVFLCRIAGTEESEKWEVPVTMRGEKSGRRRGKAKEPTWNFDCDNTEQDKENGRNLVGGASNLADSGAEYKKNCGSLQWRHGIFRHGSGCFPAAFATGADYRCDGGSLCGRSGAGCRTDYRVSERLQTFVAKKELDSREIYTVENLMQTELYRPLLEKIQRRNGGSPWKSEQE